MNETRNIIASLEFGEKESQICYYDRKEKNPVSLAVKTGTTEYTFPTRLSKRPKTNIWHFGAESEYFSKGRDTGRRCAESLHERRAG